LGHTLVTCASGFIGNAFAQRLYTARPVIRPSRKIPRAEIGLVRGEFHSFEDLAAVGSVRPVVRCALGRYDGGCSEEDGLEINVLGTRRLRNL
jgi:UDP-glucose 4-epimerase